jgi:hypothetical protein
MIKRMKENCEAIVIVAIFNMTSRIAKDNKKRWKGRHKCSISMR